MRLTWRGLDLHLKRPFVISQGAATTERTLIVELEHAGTRGLGEAAPSPRVCGETLEAAQQFFNLASSRVAAGKLREPADLLAWIDDRTGNPAARAALEMACLDWQGKNEKKPVCALLGLDPGARGSTATVSLAAPDEMAAQAVEYAAQGFRALKVKLGDATEDLPRIRAIRDALPRIQIRCDANGGWTEDEARRLLLGLEPYGIELLEQPLPRGQEPAVRRLASGTSIPLFLDESVLTLPDAEREIAASTADGINLKLMKTGGLREAARIARLAREKDWQVMIGCMIESSVAITAASHLLGIVDYADLDGAWLTSDDPFSGARIEDGTIATPRGAGLGVASRRGNA